MPSSSPIPGTVWVRDPSNRPLYYNLKEFVSYAAFSIQDIPDVSISSPTAGQVLTFNGVDWVNGAGSSGGITSILTTGPITGGPISSAGTIGITQATTTTDGYLSSADWNTFNAKQNAITLGTTAQYFRGDLSLATFPTIPTVTPSALTKTDDTNVTLTLGGTPSTALLQSVQLILGWTGTLADGRISSAATWNAKQNQLSGTGFVKASGTTISYDNSTYYLASNPSNYISLTSLSSGTGISYNNTTGVITNSLPDQTVVLNNGTGISVTGTYPNFTITNTSPSTVSPAALTRTNDTNVTLTLSGTPATSLLQSVGLTLGWTGTLADARIASATNWNTAYTNMISSLTTTGSSGAATLISNVLNIPNYTLAGLGGQPLATNLTSLSGLSYASLAFVKMSAAGTFSLDTSTYLTSVPSTTINGTTISFGGSNTITASAGTLTGTTLNGTVVSTSITSTGTLTSGTLGTGYVIAGVTMTLGSDASYDIYYRNASGILTRLANGTTGQYLAATTSSAPSWATLIPSFSGMVDTISLQDIGSAIPAQTYTFELYAEIGYTINELKIISGSGTCNAAVQINGTNVTGISAVSVSSTIATGTASAANTVVVGNKVTLVISSTSSLVNLQATLKYTRT